jgi:formylglycine-generating enzyme required for sulfatase activity
VKRLRPAPLVVLVLVLAAAAVHPPRAPGEDALPPGLKRGARPGEFVSSKDGAPMVLVPAGTFTMGVAVTSTTDDMEAMPAHEEKTGAFFIDVFEVTNGRYAKFLAALAVSGHATCPKDEPKDKDHHPLDWGTPAYDDPKTGTSPGSDYPVAGIDWYDARAYAAWAGKRLPTEVEWEKAARGTDARPFPWGFVTPRKTGAAGTSSPGPDGKIRANWRDDADGFLFCSPVGKFPEGRSPYGCEDMGGNVWEWTESTFHPYPGAFPNIVAKYPPELGATYRVYRGGSYDAGTMDIQTTHRHWIEPEAKRADFGLRCVVSAP